jgi:hypothetical protein
MKMSDENASVAGLSTQEEMHHSPRKFLDKIGVEISGHFSQKLELESYLFSVRSKISVLI